MEQNDTKLVATSSCGAELGLEERKEERHYGVFGTAQFGMLMSFLLRNDGRCSLKSLVERDSEG